MYVVQKLELGRTEMEAWQNRIGKLEALQKIICMTGRTAWQKKIGTAAAVWQNTWNPGNKKFWQEGIEFWQDEVVGTPYASNCNPVMFFPLQGIWLEVLQLILASKLGDPV